MAYKEELKISLVRQYERGAAVSDIAKESGVPENSIYRWIREYKTIKAENYCFTPREYDHLKKRVEKLTHMIEILRLSGCISAIPLKKRLPIMEAIYNSHSSYSVHEICEAMEVARGTFYNHIFRRIDTRRKEERELRLIKTVQQIYTDSGQRYGADRIMKVLAVSGTHVSKKHVLEIMQELGIESVRQGAKRISVNKKEKPANKLRRDFSADAPNMVWVSDITYFSFREKHFFICAVIDLFSRMVVSYGMSERASKQLVSSTLRRAIEERKPDPGLVFHSDRGSQYTSKSFQQLLADKGIIPSLSEKGKPYDNAVAEAFFSTMKKEELYRRDYHSDKDFRKGIKDYIVFYNSNRAHAYLNYRSPAEFEALYYEKNDNE